MEEGALNFLLFCPTLRGSRVPFLSLSTNSCLGLFPPHSNSSTKTPRAVIYSAFLTIFPGLRKHYPLFGKRQAHQPATPRHIERIMPLGFIFGCGRTSGVAGKLLPEPAKAHRDMSC